MATTNSISVKTVYFRATSLKAGSFSDARVILVAPSCPNSYPMLNVDDRKTCIATQHKDGPTYVTVGPDATESSLEKVSACYQIPLADLRLFRDGQRPI